MSFVPLLYRKTHNITKSPEFKVFAREDVDNDILTQTYVYIYNYENIPRAQGNEEGGENYSKVQSSSHKNAKINFETYQIFADVY
jgi:hypothetical protein